MLSQAGEVLFAPVLLFMFATDREYRDFQRRVDRLCSMILSSDVPAEEVERQRLELRTEAVAVIPENIDLYDMVYESRFTRLWEQFREEAAG